jgi:hypothetical protein
MSRNSWAGTSTTLPSRQIEIGRPSRICDSMTFSKAALRAISARSPSGNSRTFAGGLVVFPILRNQSFVCVWLHYTESASLFQCNSSRRMAHFGYTRQVSGRDFSRAVTTQKRCIPLCRWPARSAAERAKNQGGGAHRHLHPPRKKWLTIRTRLGEVTAYVAASPSIGTYDRNLA